MGTSSYPVFGYCTKLSSITIGDKVKNIPYHAFDDCSGLESIIVESGNTVYDSRDNCNAIIATSTNTLITGCKNTTIPNSVTSIGYCAFRGCRGLSSVTIGNSVTSIGSFAFEGCSGLTSITIPNSVTSIGGGAFEGCSGLTSVTIPVSVTSIGNYAFYGCSSLTSVNIPNSVTSIGYEAFEYCSGLTSITIPNSVTEIDKYAFYECSNLTEVTLGSSVKNIGEDAFAGAKRLAKIYSLNPTPPTCADEDVFYGVSKDQCRVYVPIGAGIYYKIAIAWRYFTYIEEKEMSGVESTLTDNDVNVVVENGNIVVNGAEDANIEVYSTNGQCVYNGTDTGIAVNTKGLYIVRVNGKSFKVIL